jgi:hypothetical protein
MKIKMYLDVFQGWNQHGAAAYTNPTWEKPVTGRRLSFTVDIPDYLISPEIDLHIQETSGAEDVK